MREASRKGDRETNEQAGEGSEDKDDGGDMDKKVSPEDEQEAIIRRQPEALLSVAKNNSGFFEGPTSILNLQHFCGSRRVALPKGIQLVPEVDRKASKVLWTVFGSSQNRVFFVAKGSSLRILYLNFLTSY